MIRVKEWILQKQCAQFEPIKYSSKDTKDIIRVRRLSDNKIFIIAGEVLDTELKISVNEKLYIFAYIKEFKDDLKNVEIEYISTNNDYSYYKEHVLICEINSIESFSKIMESSLKAKFIDDYVKS
jgi:hypothetical protein